MTVIDPAYVIERLETKHDRSEFSCNVIALERYLKTQATQDIKKSVAVTYVITEQKSIHVLGYYTISSNGIFLEDLPDEMKKKLPRYPVLPGILLGRLAVDINCQGKGIGAYLLIDALKRSLKVSQQIGSVAVIVEAKDSAAVKFYEHFGFLSFPDNDQRLFIPIKSIKELANKDD